MASIIQMALIRKKILDDTARKINAPEKHPNVRNIKYRLVAKPASVKVIPRRSIRILGAVVFVPTSIPT